MANAGHNLRVAAGHCALKCAAYHAVHDACAPSAHASAYEHGLFLSLLHEFFSTICEVPRGHLHWCTAFIPALQNPKLQQMASG